MLWHTVVPPHATDEHATGRRGTAAGRTAQWLDPCSLPCCSWNTGSQSMHSARSVSALLTQTGHSPPPQRAAAAAAAGLRLQGRAPATPFCAAAAAATARAAPLAAQRGPPRSPSQRRCRRRRWPAGASPPPPPPPLRSTAKARPGTRAAQPTWTACCPPRPAQCNTRRGAARERDVRIRRSLTLQPAPRSRSARYAAHAPVAQLGIGRRRQCSAQAPAARAPLRGVLSVRARKRCANTEAAPAAAHCIGLRRQTSGAPRTPRR